MADKTLHEWIKEIRIEAMNDIDPRRASLLLNRLSALLGSVIEESIAAEMDFNRMYEAMANKYEKITEAKVKAKVTPEYEAKLRAEGLVEVVSELIRGMKYVIKVKIQEAKETAY